MFIATKGNGVLVFDNYGKPLGNFSIPLTQGDEVISITRGTRSAFFDNEALLVTTKNDEVFRFTSTGIPLGKFATNKAAEDVPVALAAKSSGTVYMLTNRKYVVQFDIDGREVRRVKLHTDPDSIPTSIAVRDDGFFVTHIRFLVGMRSGEVQQFEENGQLSLRIGHQENYGPVTGVSAGIDDHLEVAHPTGVETFNPGGRYLGGFAHRNGNGGPS